MVKIDHLGKWTKHSFQVDARVLNRFLSDCDHMGTKKYVALEEALGMWTKKYSKQLKAIKKIKGVKDE